MSSGYYEINIVVEKPVNNHIYVEHSFSYYTISINKDVIDDLWWYIRNNKLMSAKQKLKITSCSICENGMSVTPKVTTATRQVKPKVEAYCLMFKPRHKYMQIILTTARGREIAVCITYRKVQRRAD